MRRLLMTSTLLAGLVAAPAFADNSAIGGQEPSSKYASNIDQSTAHTPYAPKLPDPPLDANADPQALLQAASRAIASGQTGMAQEALERAETRLLSRSVPPDQANTPDDSVPVHLIGSARLDIAHGDLAGANSAVQQALGALPQDQASIAPAGPYAAKDVMGDEATTKR